VGSGLYVAGFVWVSFGVRRADVTGSINGVVKDANGAVATTVEITVINVGPNAVYHATTDATGTYFVRGLPVGVYQLSVEPKGFKKFVANDLRVQVNEQVHVDIALQVGDVAQTWMFRPRPKRWIRNP
jgi:hypothetical protein